MENSQDKKYTEDNLFSIRIKEYIRLRKIPYRFLCEETGYSKVYLSKVFNGHSSPSIKFRKLIILALEKFTEKDSVQLYTLLKGSTWDPSSPPS